MSKYTGPKLKVLRQLNTQLPGLTRKAPANRTNRPGQHGSNTRHKPSDYGVRLNEKQKVRYNYGLTEKQMLRYFKSAKTTKGNTGVSFLVLLESRLDNVAFRAGFGPTIPATRQLVNHGHILVNNKVVTIPSYHIKAGDEITLHTKARNIPAVLECIDNPALQVPTYLNVDPSHFKAAITQLPDRDDIPLDIDESLIIEYYSR